MRFKYTVEHIKFLKTGYQSINSRDLTKAFNDKFGCKKTHKAIRSTLKNYNITCGRKGSDRLVAYKKLLTADQDSFLRREYKKHSLADLTRVLNDHFSAMFKVSQIKAYTKNHKILSGRTGCFLKGNKSWNTGTKGVMKPNKTSFKKGNVPANQKPIGSERICSKDGFILIKIKETNPYTGFPTRYKHKHIVNYEKENGAVPEGFVVAFKDSDKTNCEPENLMLISRAELLRLNQNQYGLMPEELKPSVLALSKLQVGIRVKEKSL